MFNPAKFTVAALILAISLVLLSNCSKSTNDNSAGTGATLKVWAHAGQAAERQVLTQQIEQYNRQNKDKVAINFIPERTYNAQVQAAAIAGDLPCLLELDGPYLYHYVWQAHVQPLDEIIDKSILDDLLPSIVEQGRYADHLYGIGSFDSGLGLFARRSVLNAQNIRIPNGPADAWNEEEFTEILQSLSKSDPDGAILDLKLNYPDEWFTYAFSPLIKSAGGDIINRNTYQSADKYLNGNAAVNVFTMIQHWIKSSYVDPNIDDNAFTAKRVALSWAGHWEYRRYAQAIGDDLVLLPLPDLGHGTKTGQGSWLWAMSAQCQQQPDVKSLLEFLLSSSQVLAMANANGAVPARAEAIAQSPLYGDAGPLSLFVKQLKYGYALPRPKTPAYPVITAAFQQAFQDTRNGADVQQSLNKAVTTIDSNIKQNKGYQLSHLVK